MTVRTGLGSLDLARLFTSAWQLRFGFVVIALALAGITATTSVVATLTSTPEQRADAILGDADAIMRLPGAALVGVDGAARDRALIAEVIEHGGTRPSIDYMTAGLRADDADETTYGFEEFSDPGSVLPRIHLAEGRAPVAAGEATVSEAIADRWPIGSTVRFLSGHLTLRIVGIHVNDFNRSSRAFVLAAGTWSAIDVDPAVGHRLAEPALTAVRWADAEPDEELVAALVERAQRELDPAAAADLAQAVDVQTRAQVEALPTAPDATLGVARIVIPLLAGLLAGVLGLLFIGRIRRTMWAVGVGFAATRTAAILALSWVALSAAVLGVVAGKVVLIAALPIVDGLSNRVLAPVPGIGGDLLSIPLALVGTLTALALTKRAEGRSRGARRAGQRDTAGIRWSVILGSATALFACGSLVGLGASEVSRITLASILVASAIVISVAPAVLAILRRTSPRSLGPRLATRAFATRGGATGVSALALLQVLGVGVAILATSFVTDVNASTESQVPPHQIVLELPGEDERADEALRRSFEHDLRLPQPVVRPSVMAGNDRADGATDVLQSVVEIEAVVGRSLPPTVVSTLENGGVAIVKPLRGRQMVTFRLDETVVSLPAVQLPPVDPSFDNISGFMLRRTAEDAGLPVGVPDYVYVDATEQQVEDAPNAAIRLEFDPSWVRVFREPDELTVPLRVGAMTSMLSVIAGVVLLWMTASQAKSLRPQLAGLRAVGVPPSFERRVVMTRVFLTFVVSSALGVTAAAVGFATATGWADLSTPLALPFVPISVMIGTFGILAFAGAVVVTRRLGQQEWATT